MSTVSRRGRLVLVLALCAAAASAAFLASAQAQTRDARAAVNVLDTAGTMWRYYEVWQTDVARLDDGKLVRVDGLKPRQRIEKTEGGRRTGAYSLLTTAKVTGSALPPEDWRTVEFDDSTWVRKNEPFLTTYRSLSMMCLRGKFQVTDAAKAGPLTLSLTYRGGVVVYLNGKEIGRAGMPKGQIAPDTLADDYSKDAFLNPDGTLIAQRGHYGTEDEVLDPESGSLKRIRKVDMTIPAGSLQKGVNVLAIEVHRAPAIPEMFTTIRDVSMQSHELSDLECNVRALRWWNRVSVDAVKLTASAGDQGIVPNSARPKGVQVWNQDAMQSVDFFEYGDPNEKIVPIRLSGLRNGISTGSVVVSSTDPIRGIKAVAGELKEKGGAVIPASALQISYVRESGASWTSTNAAGWRVVFDPLEPEAPAEAPRVTDRSGRGPAILPVWITVNVPRDARPGDYSGKITVHAEGLEKPVDVPILLHVSDWALPDPRNFTMYMSLVQSPDSVALQYNVKMWSEEHWKLLDRAFALMSQIGDKEIIIPVVRRTHFGNEQGMVHWIRKADGTSMPDFSIVERYIDTAVKHLGKVPVVNFMVAETTTKEHSQGFLYTEVDEKTGEVKDAIGPKWGTAESKAFLKPLFDGLKALMAKRGLEDSMTLGTHSNGSAAGPVARPDTLSDIRAVYPDPKWDRVSHYWFGDSELRQNRWGRVALVGGVIGVFWDVDEDKPIYGWQNPMNMIIFPRTTNADYAGARLIQTSSLPEHRLCAEAVLTSGRRHPIVSWGRGNLSGEVGYDKFLGVRGLGPFGVDFWPVLKGARSSSNLLGRYGGSWPDYQGGWTTVGLNTVVQTLLAPGKDGPIATTRFEMLREACQEAEARILVQNAILKEDTKAMLGPELAGKCKELCDERTRAFRYISEYWRDGIVNPVAWEERSRKLYDMAAEVAGALAKDKR